MFKIIKNTIKLLLGNNLSNKIHTLKDILSQKIKRKVFYLKRKTKKYFFSQQSQYSVTVGMLAIRKKDYIDLAIDSINSLHYYNSNNKVILYIDNTLSTYFNKKSRYLDYPDHVKTSIVQDNISEPWQFTKMRVVLDLSHNGIPFVDADSIWHSDISEYFSSDKTTFLVKINKFSDHTDENRLISDILQKPIWGDLYHFNIGFIYIKPTIITDEFKSFCSNLMYSLLELRNNNVIPYTIFRTCEEMTLSIAAQLFDNDIITLKDTDGPGDTFLIESIYYGCQKGI